MGDRRTQEVVPVLTAAGVIDMEGLDAIVKESRDLEVGHVTSNALSDLGIKESILEWFAV